MLSSLYRFHRRKSVQYVQKNGESYRSSSMTLRVLPNDKETSRFSVVVSKKVDKRAVVRNRIRRRIYEIIRKDTSKITGGFDCVIMVYKPETAQMPAKDLHKELNEVLKKAQLFQG